jgi:dipeptidyl aminopeptidase/acylaminoacyl peptidase
MTYTIQRFFLCSALVSSLLAIPAQGANVRTLELHDLRREVTLTEPEISPDGKRIALLVGRGDYERDIVADRIVMIDVASGAQHPLPISKDSIASLRWSPSGDRIAFLASSADDPKQLYVASPAGSGLRELTRTQSGIENFAWRPDGRAIGFVTENVAPVRHGSAKFNTSFEVGDNDYLTTAAPLPSHLWVVAISGGAPTRLTNGSWSIPVGLIEPQHFPNQFFCWYAGGRSIAYTKAPDAYESHADRSVMMVRNLATSSEYPLTARSGLEAGCDMSPDGRKIAYWYPRNGKALNASSIFVMASGARGQDGVDVTHELDRSPWQAQWMHDSKNVLILAHDGTREGMWLVRADGSTTRRLDIGDLSASGASTSDSGSIAFVASGPTTPTELYYLPAPGGTVRRLTDDNSFTRAIQLGAVRQIAWRDDGFSENGVLTYPPGYVAGKTYPLVLQIHGWPQYASQQAFDTDYPGLTQLFAAHGYLTFEPNYRGSDNMGNAFESSIIGDSDDGPSRDIMAGIAAVEKLGIVDTSRIGVSGWSYGGQLTVWLIGHQSIWKAAMAGAAPTDLPVDYAIGEYNILGRHFTGGPLWGSHATYQAYIDQSPITAGWNIKTPTLILSSIYETTVPVVHSYELYHALRDRGVPVQFVAYVSSEHFPSDPVQSEDIYRRWVGWFDRYLR